MGAGLDTLLWVAFAVGLTIVLGSMLDRRYGSQSRWASTGIASVGMLFWWTAAVFLIIGGFFWAGLLLGSLTFFLFRGNFREFKREHRRRMNNSAAGGG